MNETVIGNGIAIIEKTKKQAKRLLKLAQNSNSQIQINSLANAQELLAQINGYPHWHAFESTIKGFKNSPVVHTPIISNVIDLKQRLGQIPVVYYNQHIISFLKITEVNPQALIEGLHYLSNTCDFQMNMGFNKLGIGIFNRFKSHSATSHTFESLAQNLGLSSSLTQKLFKFDVTIEEKEGDYLCAYLIVVTPEDVPEEHTVLCNMILQSSREGFVIEQQNKIPEDYYSYMVNDENEKTYYSNFFHSKFYFEDIIHYLALLQNKNMEFNILVDVNERSFCITNINNSPKMDKYINGLMNTLVKRVQISDYQEISYEKPSFNNFEKITNIPLLDDLSTQVINYNPYSINSSLVIGPPGSGKSLFMNNMAINTLMKGSCNASFIDTGGSYKNLYSLLKDATEPSKKNLVQYHKLSMTRDYCINPFDTQLGRRFPNAEEKAFLMNFLLIITTDTNKKNPEDAMTGLIQAVIDDMYYKFSEKGNPKKYDIGINREVDECLDKISMKISHKTTWWEVVDHLIHNDYQFEAMLAQRNAVPLLADASSSAQGDRIRDIYSKVTTSTGENLVQCFNRSITDALNQCRLLSEPTKLNTEHAEILFLDLEDLVKSGDTHTEKQNAIIYMLARSIVFKNIQKSLEKNKKHFLYIDEFHRFSNNYNVINQLDIDLRNTFKFNYSVNIATQSICDIKEKIINSLIAVFILGTHSSERHEINEKLFKISESEFNKIKVFMNKGITGQKFYASFANQGRKFSGVYSINYNPYLIQLFANTKESLTIKNELLKVFDYEKVLDILVEEFPDGVKKMIEGNENSLEVIIENLKKKYQ